MTISLALQPTSFHSLPSINSSRSRSARHALSPSSFTPVSFSSSETTASVDSSSLSNLKTLSASHTVGPLGPATTSGADSRSSDTGRVLWKAYSMVRQHIAENQSWNIDSTSKDWTSLGMEKTSNIKTLDSAPATLRGSSALYINTAVSPALPPSQSSAEDSTEDSESLSPIDSDTSFSSISTSATLIEAMEMKMTESDFLASTTRQSPTAASVLPSQTQKSLSPSSTASPPSAPTLMVADRKHSPILSVGAIEKNSRAQQQSPQRKMSSGKAMFYVSDDEDDSDMDTDGCQDGDDEAEPNENEDYFGKTTALAYLPSGFCHSPLTSPRPKDTIDRRSSLLSSLLMAEKAQLQEQKPRPTSESSSCCPSAGNSDGEMIVTPVQNPLRRQRTLVQEYPKDTQTTAPVSPLMRTKRVYSNLSDLANDKSMTGSLVTAPQPHIVEMESPKPKSPLVRTKNVFKDLNTLAATAPQPQPQSLASQPHRVLKTTTNTPSPTSCILVPPPTTTTVTAATSVMAEPGVASISTAPTTLASAKPTTSWTRSHVQVQIHSLVAHSTASAQKALWSASATLADVMFRAV